MVERRAVTRLTLTLTVALHIGATIGAIAFSYGRVSARMDHVEETQTLILKTLLKENAANERFEGTHSDAYRDRLSGRRSSFAGYSAWPLTAYGVGLGDRIGAGRGLPLASVAGTAVRQGVQ